MAVVSVRVGTACIVVLAVGAAVPETAVASAEPGAGEMRVHATTTAFGDTRDHAKVCRFYVDATGFPAGRKVPWAVVPQPGTALIAGNVEAAGSARTTARVGGESGAALSGLVATAADGAGHSGPLVVANGEYRLTWHGEGKSGQAKHKTFTVSCAALGSPPGGSGGGMARSVAMVRDVFGNLVPADEFGTGADKDTAPDPATTATGIAVALGALFIGIRLLRHGGAKRSADR
ncbi:hypothetical protein [Yinghuangia soli]|uniref:Uncharacterized protein n=1 Tax=Yinghuangia soli TaxID=2908204 RepID=A0AA41U0U8_9ACTN|nr:hypothetical protein [Yinghuangia soli]MCF2528976.1 hypothetical protein [Yinghuangia soli]